MQEILITRNNTNIQLTCNNSRNTNHKEQYNNGTCWEQQKKHYSEGIRQYISVTVNNAKIELTGNNTRNINPKENVKIKLTGNKRININHKKQIRKLQDVLITRNNG